MNASHPAGTSAPGVLARAWDVNATITVTVHGRAQELIAYRVLFAAIALAESVYPGSCDVAQIAIENNALREGLNLGVAAFGSIHPGHRTHLDPEELALAVRLARRFLGQEED